MSFFNKTVLVGGCEGMEALEAIILIGDFAVGVASSRETRTVYDYYPRCQSRSVYLIYGQCWRQR